MRLGLFKKAFFKIQPIQIKGQKPYFSHGIIHPDNPGGMSPGASHITHALISGERVCFH